MDKRERALLEQIAKKTGLSRTELLRRGLQQIAEQVLSRSRAGSGFDYLMNNATHDSLPTDIAKRHDHYLAGGGYESLTPGKTRSRQDKRASSG